MELVDKQIINKITEFEFVVESITKPNGISRYIIKMDKDDYGDCIKNDWTVIGVTNEGLVYELMELANKLPTYTPNYDLQSVVEIIVLDNEIKL